LYVLGTVANKVALKVAMIKILTLSMLFSTLIDFMRDQEIDW